MFIKLNKSGYDRDAQQFAHGLFLILMQPDDTAPRDSAGKDLVRGLVRFVKMRQMGHFMMGFAYINNIRLTLSGAYGCDGLVDEVPRHVWEKGVPLPNELWELWRKGGGHNGPGAEADVMRKWGLEVVLPAMYKRGVKFKENTRKYGC